MTELGQEFGFGPRKAEFEAHATLEACLGEQKVAAAGAAAQADITRGCADRVERSDDARRRRVSQRRRKARRLRLARAAIGRIVDHVAAEQDDPLGLLLRSADERVELSLGAVDNLRRVGDAVALEFQFAQEVEGLPRGIERETVPVRDREARRLAIVIKRRLAFASDKGKLSAAYQSPIALGPIERAFDRPGDSR